MTSNPFAAPASSTGIEWKDMLGSLLLIQPSAIEEGIPTVHGPSSAVRVKMVPLDGPIAGTLHEDALVFPRVLQSQLRTRIGQMVLGRLTQGVAKPGQDAPWVLAEATEQDVQVGMAYLQSSTQPAPAQQPQQQYQAPQQQYQPPAPQQYQAPAPQQYQAPAPQQYQPQAPQQYAAGTTDAAQQQLQQQLGAQVIQQAPAAAAPQVDTDKVRQLLAVGLSDAEIAGAVGASLEVIAALRNLP